MAETPSLKELPPPPVPEFGRIIELFASQAMAASGKMPGTDPEAKRLDYMKYFIDLMEILEQKTAASLSEDEKQGLSQTLHYLRMLYVEAKK